MSFAASAGGQPNQGSPIGFQGESGIPPDFDNRSGRAAITNEQRNRASALDAAVRWNRFGTPQSAISYEGSLGTGLGRDPVDAARAWLSQNAGLLGISTGTIADLEVARVTRIGEGHSVLLEQRLGGLPVSPGGMVAVGVAEGRALYTSSSLAEGSLSGTPRLTPQDAVQRAAANVGRSIADADISAVRKVDGWTRMTVRGFTNEQSARLVAVPLPTGGAIPAYQTFIQDADAEPLAFVHYVDARDGSIVIRLNAVDHAGEPKWDIFPAYPRLNYASTDTRETWCWVAASGCDEVIAQDAGATPLAWDVNPGNKKSSFTSIGNNAIGVEKWRSNNTRDIGNKTATSRQDRNYSYAWTNQWFERRCDPQTFTTPQQNDIDAAIANLFAGHNRMHDWSYRLGFTETTWNLQEDNFGRGEDGGDAEQGNAQAGGIVGGPPQFRSRDNANQFTPPDGQPPITNMYLWQPIAGAFYAPCVDGDFDMSVIGHEYTHAISNRMVAGADQRLLGLQANAMGESWSDLGAMEILNEYGSVPVGNESPYSIGAYVTGDPVAGIRNYNMSDSPLNYSGVGYDFIGPQVHADGEIWSATNFDIRRAMNERYGGGSASLQRDCANGLVPIGSCPGNRRWIQLVFDAWTLMAAGDVTMLDARDAMLASDQIRFGGANQDLLWGVFARRGMGENATSTGSNDHEPVPSFESPFHDEATVRFRPSAPGGRTVAELFVGHYESRATPIADTDRGGPVGDTFRIVPGTFEFLARGDGFGGTRFTRTFAAGQTINLDVALDRNLASAANGAVASGDGTNLGRLIDDTEDTNWASLNAPIQGKQVTVDLAGGPAQTIERIQVSAMLRPTIQTDPGGDTGGQSRFSALRRFRILACNAEGDVDCSAANDFDVIFTSPADAFPAVAPRPRAPDLILRSFDVPATEATHVRIEVLENQCTGTSDYRGDQDDDPANITDCVEGSAQELFVRIAELQVFAQ
ncbi:MAG: peptidase M36 [Actinobacteria bacterium]|nr:peptidase M36 [Actinomycetota bacterium]